MNMIDAANVKQIPVFKFTDSLLKYQVRKANENIPKVKVKNLLGHIEPPEDSVTILIPWRNIKVMGIAIPYINQSFFNESILSGAYI